MKILVSNLIFAICIRFCYKISMSSTLSFTHTKLQKHLNRKNKHKYLDKFKVLHI